MRAAYKVCRRGAVAQLGECLTGSQEVRGSIPLSSTKEPLLNQSFTEKSKVTWQW